MKLYRLFPVLKSALFLALPLQVVGQACLTANEPNETQATGTALSLNTTVQGAITTDTDKDFYTFTVPSNQNVYISLTDVNFDAFLRLYNSSGTVLESANTGSPNEYIFRYLTAGTYSVRVHGYESSYNNFCYSLRIDAGSNACALSFEPENNSPSTATTIQYDYTYGAISTSTDVDYYKFRMYQGDRIYAFLTNLPVNLDLEFYNPAGIKVASSYFTGTYDSITYQAPAYGIYSIKVLGNNGTYSPNCYTLYIINGAESQLRKEEEAENAQVLHSPAGLHVFPQPGIANREIQLSGLPSEAARVRVIGMDGQVVLDQSTTTVHGHARVMLENVKPGIYLLEADGKERVRMVVQ